MKKDIGGLFGKITRKVRVPKASPANEPYDTEKSPTDMLVARKAEVEAHNAGVAAGYVKDLYLQVDEAGKELSKFHADQVRETEVEKVGGGGG